MTPLRIQPGVPPSNPRPERPEAGVVLRFLALVRLTGDAEAARSLMAGRVPAHQVTAGGTVVRTPDEYAEHAAELVSAAPHRSSYVTELLVDGDRVYLRWALTTDRGGESASAVYRVADGRIAEYWIQLPE